MSKRSNTNKCNKKINNNKDINTNINKKELKSNYNVIINQNSTFNQDNSINIMLDGKFPYFQNYNYQSNEKEPSSQIYPFCQDFQQKNKNNQNIIQKNNSFSNNNSNSKCNTTKKNNKNNTNNRNNEASKKINSSNNKKNENSPPKKNQDYLISENQRSTNKIDYRYVKKCPIKEMISNYKIEDNDNNLKEKDNQLFWFASYGKLMKTKHLLKIFNYYNNKPFENQTNNDYNPNFKEKTLIIKDFEIYFNENSNKPFIRYSKGGTIYTKLYLLTLREISLIFSYINRIEYKIDYDALNYLQRKGTFKIINDNSNGIILPYCLIYYLGKYMNINIYSFSNNIDFNIYLDEISFQKNQRISTYTVLNNKNNHSNGIKNESNVFSNENNHHMNNTNIKSLNYKLPNSKKIVKLVKIINLNFPDFSIDDIINYLIPDNKYINSITKINEIKNIFFFKRSNQNKFILSSMVRDTIKGISIQTPKSLLSSFCPGESILEASNKYSDLFQPTNKKYIFPIKDDYKFQTINTNEKDNTKNNPFIIYVCDNVQKINFNDNQSNNMNNDSNINKIINSTNSVKIENIKNNQNEKLNHIKKNNDNINDIINNNSNINNIINNNNNINSNINNINNNNIINNNVINNNNQIKQKSINLHKDKNDAKRKSIDAKIKYNKYRNDVNNVFMSGNKKNMKLQRISTDVREKIKSAKFNCLTGAKNCRNNIRGTNDITNNNIFIENNNTKSNRQLDKSIESHYNYSAKCRLSKTSDLSQKRNQHPINSRTMLINRINMNKKDINNPFFHTGS